MASDLQQQIDRVKAKTQVLSEKYKLLAAKYDEARAEISNLKAQVLADTETIERLRVKAEYLSVASNINPSAADLQATRSLIADLIREIDRSIADLVE